MPTMRSHFKFEQFRRVFQAFAYEAAKQALEELDFQRLIIKAFGNRMSEVDTDVFHIKFYATHLSVTKKGKDGSYFGDGFSFDVEEKLYTNSNHSTKITFWEHEINSYDSKAEQKKKEAENKERKKNIMAFIEENMKNEQPEPRFSLKDTAQ